MKLKIIFYFLTTLVFCQLTLRAPLSGADSPTKNIANQQSAFSQQKIVSPVLSTQADAAQPTAEKTGTEALPNLAIGKTPVHSNSLLKWIHMLDRREVDEIENSSVIAFAPHVSGDLARILIPTSRAGGFWGILWRTVVSLAIAFGVVFTARRIARKSLIQFEQIVPHTNDRFARFWASILRSIPSLAGFLLLALISIIGFLFLDGGTSIQARMLFQVILGTVLFSLFSLIVSRVIFAPDQSVVRPLALPDAFAKSLHYASVTSATIIGFSLLLLNLLEDLGAFEQTIAWSAIVLVSSVMLVFVLLILYLRQPVSTLLQANTDRGAERWYTNQIAVYWHVPALLYLFILWFVWIGRVITGTMVRNGSFLVSLLIIPIYLVLSYVGYVVIASVVDSLGLSRLQTKDDKPGEEDMVDEQYSINQKKAIVSKSHLIFKFILGAALAIWVLSLWGYQIPFAARVVKAIFESFVTLSLALVSWRFAASYIEKKINEATPVTTEEEAGIDPEFGGAVPHGRSFTLLPMLRKVIGSFLVVLVILTVLSSLGINIGPLLAGAGVFGLAIGFGARKLVADIFSGFFFLLDDAFRVGEYIQSGSTQGTVEAITLRNVMLRHHLGMLQIVPHSDLGAVTNFNRGGIVIKFPLEFPYGTDIDQVRKIIKGVGQEMLEDEETGGGFIKPIKSQGVHGISNSVMVIRVKFTAKPGTQFVIKREAYRRLTEAFNAKGIHYAHRKVIVDFPEVDKTAPVAQETRNNLLRAGAAVVLADETDQNMAKE